GRAAGETPAQSRAATGAGASGSPHRAAPGAALRTRGVRLRGTVFRCRRSSGTDRHLSGLARNDSIEVGARISVGQLWTHSRVQARAPVRCTTSDWGSGGTKVKITEGQDRLEAEERLEKLAEERADHEREGEANSDDQQLPRRGSAELKAIIEAL